MNRSPTSMSMAKLGMCAPNDGQPGTIFNTKRLPHPRIAESPKKGEAPKFWYVFPLITTLQTNSSHPTGSGRTKGRTTNFLELFPLIDTSQMPRRRRQSLTSEKWNCRQFSHDLPLSKTHQTTKQRRQALGANRLADRTHWREASQTDTHE